MDAQESGASALAGIALQLTLLDKLVEKGVLDADEVQLILLEADARLARSPNMTVTGRFLADLRKDLHLKAGDGKSSS